MTDCLCPEQTDLHALEYFLTLHLYRHGCESNLDPSRNMVWVFNPQLIVWVFR